MSLPTDRGRRRLHPEFPARSRRAAWRLAADRLMATNRGLSPVHQWIRMSGPLADAPAYDHVVQALSGFAALPPAMVCGDGGHRQGHRLYGGAGRDSHWHEPQAGWEDVEVSMLDVAIAFLWPDGMMNHTIRHRDQILPPVSRSFRSRRPRTARCLS